MKKFFNKIGTFLSKVKKVAIREKDETVVAAKILRKFVLKGHITEEEKEFLKGQSTDLARLLPIVAAQAIPSPVPITPLLILLGKKIGIDLIPKDQEIPEEYEKKKKE